MPQDRDATGDFVRSMRQFGVDVSRETITRLEILISRLQRWQKAINLIGRTTLEDIWQRHVLDSAQLVPLLPESAQTVVDLGSGGGFPGLVLAALRPGLDVTLIEADSRKAAFLAEAGRHMDLPRPPRVIVSRVEQLSEVKAEVVTARALASLNQLLSWAEPLRLDTAICLFHKGKDWRTELTEAMKDWDIPYQSFTSVTDRDAVIFRIGQYTPSGVRHR